jgi:hypothetical protein
MASAIVVGDEVLRADVEHKTSALVVVDSPSKHNTRSM